MAEIREATIRALSGTTNGVNKVFATPTEYQAGSLRVVWNGQVYEPTDDYFGWVETGTNQVTLTTAPRAGDVLQAFYRDLTGVEVDPEDVVVGSPFYPGELGP
jgi:hypothetical protein